jgi:hypothetical protein
MKELDYDLRKRRVEWQFPDPKNTARCSSARFET